MNNKIFNWLSLSVTVYTGLATIIISSSSSSSYSTSFYYSYYYAYCSYSFNSFSLNS